MEETMKLESQVKKEFIDLLIVDDDSTFLDLISRQLEEGSNVIKPRTCNDPEEALEIIDNEKIDCVLSDYKMPGMNGIELLNSVRSRRPEIPFIILTSEGNEEIASQAISSDVTDYIKKGGTSEHSQLIIKRIENAVLKNRAETKREKERKEHEDTLKKLQEVSQELIDAENKENIYQLTLEASKNILNFPGVGIYLLNENEDGNQLEPKAHTDYLEEVLGELPVLDSNESITWRSFQEQEIVTIDDIEQVEKYTDKTPIKSGIWVPLGEKGVLAVLSEEISGFNEQDCHLAEILASATETALKRVEREEKLRESKNQYRALVENLPNGSVTLFDHNLRFQTARGETIRRAYGTSNKIEGKTIHEMYDGETLEKIEDCFKKALNGEKSTTEVEAKGMILELNAAPIRDDEGNIVSGMSVARDITSKKEREKKLKMFKSIIDTIDDGVYLINEDHEFEMANPAYCEMTGFMEEELVGAPATKVVSEEVAEEAREKLSDLEEGESAKLKAEMKNANGEKIIGESNFTALVDEDGNFRGKIGVVRDVTRKKELEEKLRKTQRDNREVAESMIDVVEDYAIFRLDPEGHVTSWNEGAEEIKGYKEDEIIGEHFSKFYTEEDRAEGRPEKNLERARKNGKAEDWAARVRKDGSRFWANVTITAIRNKEGELTGFTKVTEDITEQYKRKQDMKTQLEEFSSIISHDLKNPLEVAKGYIDLAQETKENEDLERAENALDKMSQIIEDTHIITMKPENLEKTEISLENMFRESWSVAEKTRTEDISYNVEDTRFEGNPTSLVRLFGNLIQNSMDHNKGEIEVRAGPTENGFYYEDDGKGIPDSTKEEVLDHGFTTSEGGRGLGMYIVKRISNLHNWDLKITESEEGGARFEFTFKKDSSSRS